MVAPFRPTHLEQHKALSRLLMDMFAFDELERFFLYGFGETGRDIVDSVNFKSSKVAVVKDLVEALLQRRVLSDLWTALYKERPRRKSEIAAVERMFVWRHVPAREKIKVLIATADVDPHSPLDLDGEIATIRSEVSQAINGHHFEFVVRETVTWDRLVGAVLTERPRIVQFSGHSDGNGMFTFANAVGGVDRSVTADMFAGLMIEQQGDVMLVLLNACYSAVVAERLSSACDHVIGMMAPIQDAAAIRFASVFYRSLAQGTTIAEAFGVAANELIRHGQQSVPMLYPPRSE